MATAEASSNLARFDGVRYGLRAARAPTCKAMYGETRDQGFGAEVKRRIILGTFVLSSGYYDAYYLRAQKVRTLIRRDFEQAFEACDVVATPTTPTPAFRLGEKTDDPLQMYLADIFTVPANLAGTSRALGPLRLRRRACPSACSCWAAVSTRRRCCASRPAPTRRPPTTIGPDPPSDAGAARAARARARAGAGLACAARRRSRSARTTT